MKIDKVEISWGIAVLCIGVILLIFAFFNAYGFLTGLIDIPGSESIGEAFGAVLAPLIAACIRVLYLGIMGWIGSILTIRGIQLMKMERQAPSETKQKTTPTTKNVNVETKKTTT